MTRANGRSDFLPDWRHTLRAPLFLALAGLWLLLAGMEWIRPGFFLHDDNAVWFAPAYAHDFRVLTETGRLAEVNFNQYGGEPFIEQGQTAVLYPPIYLGVALAKWISGDLRWAIDWIAAVHLTLGLIGFHLWLRQGGVNQALAAVGGLAWVLNPFVLIVASSWIMVSYVAAWLPWLFWALDRVLIRPTNFSAIALGTCTALFFLQGYVQWFVYGLLFLAFYGLSAFFMRVEARRVAIVNCLALAALVFLIFSLPLLLPMQQAANVSTLRGTALPVEAALFYRVPHDAFLRAQICLFKTNLVFGGSTAMLYCPALLFLPVVLVRFFQVGSALRRRLFALVPLSVLAIAFSSRWHVFLTLMPVIEKFRWPFKVFVFADFFLIAALAWSVTPWTADRRSNRIALACAGLVLAAGASIPLAFHDNNIFSQGALPSSQRPVPPGIDPSLGRVVAISDRIPQADSSRFLSHCQATYFEIPSIGGYNPLVNKQRLDFGLGLDYPNVYDGEFTPEFRAKLEARAVRYWIVDTNSGQFPAIQALDGLNVLATEPDRMIFEDPQAAPLVYSASDPATAIPVSYAGNSLRIPLTDASSPLEVSVGPTDGWWYRVDRGPWQRGDYRDYRLKVEFLPGGRLLEISYFDPRFRAGLLWSAGLLLLLACWLAIDDAIRTSPSTME